MVPAMSPGVLIAIGIVAGTALGLAINNAYLGLGLGVAAGILWYAADRYLRRRRS